MNFFDSFYDAIGRGLRDVKAQVLQDVCGAFRDAQMRGRKVIVAGNGGSAAMASHVSVDLTKAARVRAVCFNESDLITCFANDYGYEHWLARALQDFGDPGDVAVLISSSGQSPNILNGAQQARTQGLTVVTLSGFLPDNPLRQLGDWNLWVDSSDYNVVESVHQTWLLGCVNWLQAEADRGIS
jgi:D-sedoheptulose 7-phosphate isomerase